MEGEEKTELDGLKQEIARLKRERDSGVSTSDPRCCDHGFVAKTLADWEAMEERVAQLQDSLPLVDNRTRNEAIGLFKNTLRISSEGTERSYIPYRECLDVVTSLLVELDWLRKEILKYKPEVGQLD